MRLRGGSHSWLSPLQRLLGGLRKEITDALRVVSNQNRTMKGCGPTTRNTASTAKHHCVELRYPHATRGSRRLGKRGRYRMECFAHPNEIAVGLCKSCGKGVCRSCALPVDRGLACSERCRPIAESLSRLQIASINNVGLYSVQRFAQPLIALVFLLTGFYLLFKYRSDAFTWFILAAGAVFALVSAATWFRFLRRK